MNTIFFSRLIRVFDRIIFRIIPGGCFLLYAGQIVNRLDLDLRATSQEWLLGILYLLSIAFFASIVWWIAVPSAFEPAVEKPGEDVKSLIGNAIIFVVSILSLFYLSPPQSYFQYFSSTGILLYVGVFIADVFFMIQSSLLEMMHKKTVPQEEKPFLSKKSLLFLSLYFCIGLLLPALFVMYKFFVQIFAQGTSQVILISLVISFVIKIFVRYQKQSLPK